MDAITFCKQLAARISDDEWRLLAEAHPSLVINEHNRTTLLELRAVANGACGDGTQGGLVDGTQGRLAGGTQGRPAKGVRDGLPDRAQGNPADGARINAAEEARGGLADGIQNGLADAAQGEQASDLGGLASGVDGADSINAQAAEELAAEIQGYLDEYMANAPEGHKWIVLASLYLTFVARRPMHPIERVGVIVRERDGRPAYLCPSKTPGDNPICDSCVCEPLHD